MGWIVVNLAWFAWALLGAGAIVFCWALFWDRARGRPRCRKCRYRMEGIPAAANGSIVCPECGRQHARARQLLYTRRRWVMAALSLGLVSISWYALAFHWRFRERGWMGYVPTTVLVVLPQSADAWYKAGGYKGSTAPLTRELLYRADTIGMREWQEYLWVLNLRNRAEANSSEGWKWRFVRAPDRNDRQWKRHRCHDWCTAFVHTYGRQDPCPGEGAWYIEAPAIIESIESSGWIATLMRGIQCPSRFDLEVCLEVNLRSSRWWPEISEYVAYLATDRGDELVREGLRHLWQPANWRPDTGSTGIPDIQLVMEDGQTGYIRQFDLGSTIDAVRVANEDARLEQTDQNLLDWILEWTITDLAGFTDAEMLYPFECSVYRRSLFIASTREGLDEVTRRIEELHKRAPTLWRELQDE
ncbi:MAG: hypothetical protein KF757_00700 [Phycisphaeraceae bacterium]|nr:hypothetical protein [Phycisphaeraceae bacterium]MCW5761726.1 hypothetical protein [Phycisphaeraceae bacterium]